MTPTARTLEHLRRQGYTVAVVERHVRSFITVDLFGCIDIVAIKPDENGVLAIQATSAPNHSARVLKSCAEKRLRTWLSAGNRFMVVSWAKRGPRGGQKAWTPRIDPLTLDDLPLPEGDLL